MLDAPGFETEFTHTARVNVASHHPSLPDIPKPVCFVAYPESR
ncbi:MAG: hypothetical protein OCU18_08695 [Candidatus Syntrophoarchaeum sp.]|nr:hypothetical protein [Candidatus Syntrophoarchaeum sp.]